MPSRSQPGAAFSSRCCQGAGWIFPTRAIAAFRCAGAPSPAKSPRPTTSRAAGDWHRTAFGGLDEHRRAVLDGVTLGRWGQGVGHHGRISNIPASNVWADTGWVDDQYRLWVRGKVAEAEALGTNLVLTREISTELGASHLTIRDHVENRTFDARRAHDPLPLQLGFPLLSQTTRLLVNSEEVSTRDANSLAATGSLGSLRAAAVGPTASAFLSPAQTGLRLAKLMSCWRGCRIMPMGRSRSICLTPTRHCPGLSTGSA